MVRKRPDAKLHNGEYIVDDQPRTMMVYLSRNYFDTANDLRKLALEKKTDFLPHSWHTYPSIIMFVIALETFINEVSDDETRSLQLSDKLNVFVKGCLPNIQLINCQWYQDICALIDIRNELVHYIPVMRTLSMCPANVQSAMLRSKITLSPRLNYITNLGNPLFADWAFNCVKRFGKEVTKNRHPINNTLMTTEEYGLVMDENSVKE